MRGFVTGVAICLVAASAAAAQDIAGGVVRGSGVVSGSFLIEGPGDTTVFTVLDRPAVENQPPATGTSTIRGRVLDATSGTPLRRAIVTVSSTVNRDLRSKATDADGRYSFDALPAGRYHVVANRSGYVSWSYGQTRSVGDGKPVVLADRQTLDRIDLALPRGGVISGRVLDEYGEPVPDVQVMAMRNQFTAAGRRPAGFGRAGSTNDIGEFRLFGLAPGDYVISTVIRGSFTTGTGADDDRSGYAPTYYPGTTNVEEAQAVQVAAGETVTGLSMVMIPTRMARVSGVAVDAEGRPLPNGFVTLRFRGGQPNGAGGGQIRSDGTFVVAGLAPGSYTLVANVPSVSQPNQIPDMAVASIVVTGEDITGVRLEPRRAVTVSGRVVVNPPGAPGLRPQMLRFAPATIALSGEPDTPATPVQMPAAVREDWTFSFKSYPGVFAAGPLGLPPGWMVRSIRWRGTDVTERLEVHTHDIADLEIEIGNRAPDLSGRVTNDRGEAATDYTAIVFPQDRDAWDASPAAGHSAVARPDDQGQFRIRTLRPGAYYIAAVVEVENGQWFDREFLERLRGGATRIIVAEGDTKMIDLRLTEPR